MNCWKSCRNTIFTNSTLLLCSTISNCSLKVWRKTRKPYISWRNCTNKDIWQKNTISRRTVLQNTTYWSSNRFWGRCWCRMRGSSTSLWMWSSHTAQLHSWCFDFSTSRSNRWLQPANTFYLRCHRITICRLPTWRNIFSTFLLSHTTPIWHSTYEISSNPQSKICHQQT